MSKTADLEKLSKYLFEYFQAPADWNKSMTAFVDHEDFDIYNEFTLSRWEQHFRHISLDLALMKVSEEHPELKISFQTYPKKGDRSDNYDFYCDKVGRLFVYSRAGWLPNPWVGKSFPCAKFEKIIRLNNKPVVFDIKLASWHHAGVHRKKGRIRSLRAFSIDHLLRKEGYDEKLKPLREFWGGDNVGYVVIIPKDIYHEKNGISPLFMEFIFRGGGIVPFYTDRAQFRQEVRDNIKKYGLRVKEPINN